MIAIQLPNGAVVDAWTLLWLLPLTLAVLALIQLAYVTWLRYAPVKGETPPPSQPILPATYPPYTPGAAGSGAAAPGYAPPPAAYAPAPAAGYAPPPAAYAPPPAPGYAPPPAAGYAPPAARPAGMVTMGKFIVLSGLESPKEIALPGSDFFIGRFYSPESSVLVGLDEKSISRKHARFTGEDTLREYYLRDMNSSFGTFLLLNGNFEQLSPERQERVYNEDVVQFGNSVTIRLILPCETRMAMTAL
ncbi:MAG: FHA domain-containing protein [Anaerolineae bacterium]|jgi:hypothetical protein|nr:FHA domain-containing protein [Anaerolineae bacterium]